MKNALTNFAIAVVASLFAFGCAELVVRMLYKDETNLFPRYHTDYAYGKYRIRGYRPGMEYWRSSVDGSWKFTTNSRGFHNTREFAYEKPAGALRVLSLGDSHTQGSEVRQDQTFSSVLERALSRPGRPAEVINTGVSGFGTAEQLALLENEGVKYRPDVVVLAFFANDFDDNLKSDLFGLDAHGKVVEKKFEHLPGVRIQNFIYAIPGVRWLSENSYFYSLLFNKAWILAKWQLGRSTAKNFTKTPGEQPTEIGGFEYTIPQRVTPYQVDLAFALIERMQRFCAGNGIRLILVDIPAYGSEPYRAVPSLTGPMVERLRGMGVEVVHSLPLFAPYDGAAEIHVPHGERHISEFAHALIGAEIARRIEGAGEAPETSRGKPPS